MTNSGADRPASRGGLLLLVACLMLATACSPETSEQKVLHLIDRAEAAAFDNLADAGLVAPLRLATADDDTSAVAG